MVKNFHDSQFSFAEYGIDLRLYAPGGGVYVKRGELMLGEQWNIAVPWSAVFCVSRKFSLHGCRKNVRGSSYFPGPTLLEWT